MFDISQNNVVEENHIDLQDEVGDLTGPNFPLVENILNIDNEHVDLRRYIRTKHTPTYLDVYITTLPYSINHRIANLITSHHIHYPILDFLSTNKLSN